MRGAGHFAFGFLVAYVGLLVALRVSPSTGLRLYGPFLPFAVGAYAAVPYAAEVLGMTSSTGPRGGAWNLFMLYPWLESHRLTTRLFSEFHLNAGLVTLAYSHLVLRYIKLVKQAGLHHA